MRTRLSIHMYRVACLGAVLTVLLCHTPERIWAQEAEEQEEGLTYEEVANEHYQYDPVGKRDPFSSPFSNVAESQAPTVDPQTPLQRFELGQLTLVGVILNPSESKALIEDSKGLGYVVTPGTLIGSRGGVVKTIEPRRITVEEYEIDFYGKRQRKERELKLMTARTAAGEDKKR